MANFHIQKANIYNANNIITHTWGPSEHRIGWESANVDSNQFYSNNSRIRSGYVIIASSNTQPQGGQAWDLNTPKIWIKGTFDKTTPWANVFYYSAATVPWDAGINKTVNPPYTENLLAGESYRWPALRFHTNNTEFFTRGFAVPDFYGGATKPIMAKYKTHSMMSPGDPEKALSVDHPWIFEIPYIPPIMAFGCYGRGAAPGNVDYVGHPATVIDAWVAVSRY